MFSAVKPTKSVFLHTFFVFSFRDNVYQNFRYCIPVFGGMFFASILLSFFLVSQTILDCISSNSNNPKNFFVLFAEHLYCIEVVTAAVTLVALAGVDL